MPGADTNATDVAEFEVTSKVSAWDEKTEGSTTNWANQLKTFGKGRRKNNERIANDVQCHFCQVTKIVLNSGFGIFPRSAAEGK